MKKLFFTLTTILITFSSFAANIDWTGNGGNGNWNLAANWSTGTVPTINDDVNVNTGSVYINGGVAAFAKSVYIWTNVTLTVKAGGSLTVTGSDKTFGLRNYGQFIVRGLLEITDLTNIPSLGLENWGTVEIAQAGVVLIDGFYYGIDNWGSTNNLGLIDIANANYGIQQYSTGTFINGQTGIISINGTRAGIIQHFSTNNFTLLDTLM
ncbi:MAG: hypothetical protein IPN76_20235 [Saprospiraceae bacterium]|nr:hypothetical protein [Saprospiraceae bacterium]